MTLDRRSLQHMGSQTLALAESVSASEAQPGASGTVLYADLLGLTLVSRSSGQLAVMLAGLGVVCLILAWERRAFRRPLLVILAAWIGAAALR